MSGLKNPYTTQNTHETKQPSSRRSVASVHVTQTSHHLPVVTEPAVSDLALAYHGSKPTSTGNFFSVYKFCNISKSTLNFAVIIANFNSLGVAASPCKVSAS